MRATKALGALIVLAALVAGPPWALVRFIGNPWPQEGLAWSAPLTDGAILGLLALIVWVLWAQLMACITVELVAALTDDRIQLRVPFALPVQRHLARQLVTTLVLLAVSASVGASTPAAAHAPISPTAPAAAPAPVGPSSTVAPTHTATGAAITPFHGSPPTSVPASTGVAAAAPEDGRLATDRTPELPTVTVMRLDSLWSIAERVLGDGDRWPEIAELNEGRTMSDGTRFTSADHIKPGWKLLIPPAAAHHDERRQGAGRATARDHASPPPNAKLVLIEKGDTLSQIALDELGDPMAYPTIVEASQDILQPDGRHLTDPDVIDVGWTVRLPQPAPHDGTQPGNTATPPDTGHTETAQNHHDGLDGHHRPPSDTRPPPLVTTEPPAVTAAPEPPAEAPEVPSAHLTPDRSAGTTGQSDGSEPDTQTTQSQTSTGDPRDQGDHVDARDQGDAGGITALRALLATAICMSAGALGLIALNRRRQFRRRRIGRTIASTPTELLGVEQAIVEHGSPRQVDVKFLDRALRQLAASCRMTGTPLPLVGAAVLSDETLMLLFTHQAPAETPTGWSATSDARTWALQRDIVEDCGLDLEDQPAPYPALVTIGLDEHGHTWLLNLETQGVCGISGPSQQAADLTRFIVAELAINAWSHGTEVLLIDQVAEETVALNPNRLRQVDRPDALARARTLTTTMDQAEENLGADLSTRRRDSLLLDTTGPVVLIVESPLTDPFVDSIEKRDHSRVAVVHHAQVGSSDSDLAPLVELSEDGTAFLPTWGVDLQAFLLPADDAHAMAVLVASTRNLVDEPVPATATDDGPLGAYALADGSLREEYTAPRHPEGGDPSSQLPDADETYLVAAATTKADLAAAAPSIPDSTRKQIEALDPDLDQDVADWFDQTSTRPKIHLLGPVEVTARNGGDPQAIDNLGGTISFIAYLACQDRGVTSERAAAACGWRTQRTVQNRATNARHLLGTSSDGNDWLPDAGTSEGARRGSAPTYELLRHAGGVLNSADLFIRLKFRAQKHGDDCEQDLLTALSLVTGAPFEAATEYRYKWLFQPGQQRHDEILVGAIHDAAHVLATRALAVGRTDYVEFACEAALKASPHSDIAWLDQTATTEASIGHAQAHELVRDQVLDRYDEDLSPRSETIIRQGKWGAAG